MTIWSCYFLISSNQRFAAIEQLEDGQSLPVDQAGFASLAGGIFLYLIEA
jgi:hypothetical protein